MAKLQKRAGTGHKAKHPPQDSIHCDAVIPAEPSSRLQVGWGENESVGKGQPTRRNGVIPVPNFGGSNFLCSCSAKIRPKLVQARLGATATGG